MKLGTTEEFHINKYILTGIIIIALLLLSCYLVEICNTPPLEDIYFSSFDAWADEKATIIYKYDAQTETVDEIGRVPGYYFSCKIRSEKDYIIGLRNADFFYDKRENAIPGVEFGVVKFYLSDGTSEVVLSDDEIRKLEIGEFRWQYSFPCGDGKKIKLCYYEERSGGTDIIYDIETREKTRITMPNDGWFMYDIRDNIVWYRKERGNPVNSIIVCNMETGERRIAVGNRSVWNCAISDDGTKIAFLNDGIDDIYLYDENRKETRRILRSNFISCFSCATFYSSAWDRSGNYYYYIEHLEWIIGASTKIKVYNVQTGRSTCICEFRRDFSSYNIWEFIRYADNTSESNKRG